MKTVTGLDILNLAGTLAQRTRDKIPLNEQDLLQGYIADAFQPLFDAQIWPELVPVFFNVQNIVNNQFPMNEGSVDPANPEMGDILAILDVDPHTTDYWRHIKYSAGDNVIYLDDPCTSCWVEYMLPYPGVTFPDLSPAVMTAANFQATLIPRRFRGILAHFAAAELLMSDNNAQLSGVRAGRANTMYEIEVNRLPPTPPWRAFKMESAGRHRFGVPAGWCP